MRGNCMRIITEISILALLFCFQSSCATKSESGKGEISGDHASVQAVKNRFVLGVQTKNIDELMSLLTEDFVHNHFGGRDNIRMILEESARMGYLDTVYVDMLHAEESVGEDGFGTVGPINVSGLFGHINFHLYFQKNDGKWYIHKFIVDV